MKALTLTLAACVALAIGGCGGDDSTTDAAGSGEAAEQSSTGVDTSKKPEVEVPSGAPPKKLVKRDLVEGEGALAEPERDVTMQYVGVGYKSGKEFDSSWSRSEPFFFKLGTGMVIPGWEQGIVGMKVGGRRELIIPPDLAYGEAGAPPSIGPNETLIFVVDLLNSR